VGRLSGKIALVTGGGRGIGLATAELFAAEGATVVAADREIPAEDSEGPSFRFASLDVSSEAGWRNIVSDLMRRYGRIDILINNAGIAGSYASVEAEALEDWNATIAVNQTGVFLGMREVLPHMRANRRGSIVNVSSIWGITAVPGAAAYHATKGAVRMMSKQAAVDYAKDGVRVNSIHPGIIATPLVAQQAAEVSAAVIAATPMGRMGAPEELAAGCLFLASDESSFMTGAELVIDGGYTAQ